MRTMVILELWDRDTHVDWKSSPADRIQFWILYTHWGATSSLGKVGSRMLLLDRVPSRIAAHMTRAVTSGT
jgi:hypothetical protein